MARRRVRRLPPGLAPGRTTERPGVAWSDRAVRTLLDAVPALPLDTRAADRAAEVRRALEKRGSPTGMGDSLIAGIVLAAGGILLTRNVTRFERVEGLRLSGRHQR